jgi:hypothetical protein
VRPGAAAGVDAGKGEEVLGLALVAAVQTAAAAQPGHRALDHPAVSAQAAGRFDATAGDARHDLPTQPDENRALSVDATVPQPVLTKVAQEVGAASARAIDLS